jgi:hypothetical protein
MHTLLGFSLFFIFIVVVCLFVKWVFFAPSDTSDAWMEKENTTVGHNAIGASFTGAAIGSSVATMLEETLEEDEVDHWHTPLSDEVVVMTTEEWYKRQADDINHNGFLPPDKQGDQK